MSNNSISLQRVIKAAPEKVFRAFTDTKAYEAWIPPYGFIGIVHQMDFRVGGSFKMEFKNFSTGNGNAFGGQYLEIIPNELIKVTDKFDAAALQGTMVTTFRFKKVICGTELTILQEGIPEVIPLELCYLGWQDSLDKLIRLVEPDIKDS
ncbi:MAG: SRPBCC family protein [Bacteroidetes bacterium]|nr:SRPBCC family protein [Bacteroidota bacterium]